MKKTISIMLVMLMMSMCLLGKDNKSKPVLRFSPDGKFKIVQFTDIHFQYDSYRSDSALALMKNIIGRENPDLVILTGDIVCSKNTHLAWNSLSKTLIDSKVPWALTLGNHDVEYEMTGKQIMEMIAGLPGNLTTEGPENISGNGNYVLKIMSSKSSKTAALLYCFDSHTSFDAKSDLGSYEWINFDQIEWYRKISRKFTKSYGGKPFPALAFFHIPLPEYKDTSGRSKPIGIQKESVCSPDINTGLFAAMLESKDVMGIFAGHDHNNNYISCLHNICLAYGNVTGRQCYGDIGRGARVVEIYEGKRKFDTWILKLYECNRDSDTWVPTNDGQRKYFVAYPDSFTKK
jgi:hypothetical protein